MEDSPGDDPHVLPVHGELQAEGELTLEHVQHEVIRDDGVDVNCGNLHKQ